MSSSRCVAERGIDSQREGAGFAAPFPLKGPSLPLGVEGGPPRMDDCRGGGPGWGFEGYLGFPKIEFQR